MNKLEEFETQNMSKVDSNASESFSSMLLKQLTEG